MSDRRILYATAVYDQDEIDAVLSVMNGEADSLRIGRNVREMEQQVSALFGKQSGVMVN